MTRGLAVALGLAAVVGVAVAGGWGAWHMLAPSASPSAPEPAYSCTSCDARKQGLAQKRKRHSKAGQE